MKWICMIIISLLCTSWHSRHIPLSSGKIKTLVIDAGHGGKDPGTNNKNSKEKDIALSIALELGRLIQKSYPAIKVIYTRKTDVFVELSERTEIANKAKADLFISIHVNSSKKKHLFGSETYVMGTHKSDENFEVAMRENSSILQEDDYKKRYQNFDPGNVISYIKMANYQSANQALSLDLASRIEQNLEKNTGRKSRGVKQSGFLVLWKTAMPSVLVEMGFLTNKTDEIYLKSALGKKQISEAIFNAFKSYKWKVEKK